MQNHLIWNIFIVLSKISVMGYFSHSIFVKKYKFHIRIKKYQLIKIFEIHLAIKYIVGWVQDWCTLTKLLPHIIYACIINLKLVWPKSNIHRYGFLGLEALQLARPRALHVHACAPQLEGELQSLKNDTYECWILVRPALARCNKARFSLKLATLRDSSAPPAG